MAWGGDAFLGSHSTPVHKLDPPRVVGRHLRQAGFSITVAIRRLHPNYARNRSDQGPLLMMMRLLILLIETRRWIASAIAMGLLCSSSASAATAKVCAEAYERAQVERKAGRLTQAIGDFTRCAAQDCPGFIRKDCVDWLADAEKARPSLVFSVRRNGVDLVDVEVSCDGVILSGAVSGKAVAVDPGQHLFVFRTGGTAVVERQIVVHEGERNRMIEIEMQGSTSVATTVPLGRPADRATDQHGAAMVGVAQTSPDGANDAHATDGTHGSILPYGLAGLGVLGVSGFAAFGLWGYSQEKDLKQSCSPFCQSSDANAVRTKYWVADGCLAVGVVSLAVATYLFVTKPKSPTKVVRRDTSFTIAPALAGQGGVVDFATSF